MGSLANQFSALSEPLPAPIDSWSRGMVPVRVQPHFPPSCDDRPGSVQSRSVSQNGKSVEGRFYIDRATRQSQSSRRRSISPAAGGASGGLSAVGEGEPNSPASALPGWTNPRTTKTVTRVCRHCDSNAIASCGRVSLTPARPNALRWRAITKPFALLSRPSAASAKRLTPGWPRSLSTVHTPGDFSCHYVQEAREEAARVQKLHQTMRGKNYTYGSQGQVLVVQPPNPDRLPSHRSACFSCGSSSSRLLSVNPKVSLSPPPGACDGKRPAAKGLLDCPKNEQQWSRCCACPSA